MVPVGFQDFLGKSVGKSLVGNIGNSHAVKFTFTQPRVFPKKKKSSSIQLPVKFLPFYLSFLWITLHAAKKTKY